MFKNIAVGRKTFIVCYTYNSVIFLDRFEEFVIVFELLQDLFLIFILFIYFFFFQYKDEQFDNLIFSTVL